MANTTGCKIKEARSGSLERLVRRFSAMVEVRRELAIELRNRDHIETALAMEAKADAYQSACRELERVMAGEMPAEPYDEWPESPNDQAQRRAATKRPD